MSSIKSYRSAKAEIRNNSKIKGEGLFAKKRIKKGEVVFVKSGHIVNSKEAKKLDKKFGEYCLQITEDLYLCPTTYKELEDTKGYLNHSCNPNVGPDGEITFIALRNISPDEELTYDYATTTPRNYKFKCNCKSKNCRGIVTGNDWKLKELQDRYGKHFINVILKKIKKN